MYRPYTVVFRSSRLVLKKNIGNLNSHEKRSPLKKKPLPVPFRLKRKFIPYGNAFLSGCLLALSFPRPELYLLAWIAFVPLFFAVQSESFGRAFFLGWMCGLVYFCGTIYWLTITMIDYGGLPLAISILLMLLLVSYLALYVGIFSFFIRYVLVGRGTGLLLFGPSLWVILEFLKGHLFTGFPWASLAYSQYRFLPMIQIADFGGIYGVGFVIVLVNTGLFLTIRTGWEKHQIAWSPLGLSIAIVLLTFIYGRFRLSQTMEEDRMISVAVIQGNIPQDQKWDRSFQDLTVERYKHLSLSVLQTDTANRPDLIVWPEAALPFIFDAETAYQNDLLDFVGKAGVDLLVGAPSIQSEPSGKVSLLNSAYLLSPIRGIVSRYDKIHLVPFGEYVPLPSLLFFVSKWVEGVADFIPGKKPIVMESAETKIGTVICFEVIFPEVVRHFVKEGANLMTTITNDAWFGHSSAPYQHFSMVSFRAIENRIPFARAANSGISGFIDSYGRIIDQTALFVAATAIQRLHPGNKETFYTRYGDIFAGLCGIITLLFLSITFIKRRERNAL